MTVTPLESNLAAKCPNCEAEPATGPFCPHCGQRNDRLRLSGKGLLKEAFEALFKVDRKFASTVKALVLPGQLTIDYLEGRRARHVKPLTLYLVCAGLFYLAHTVSAQGAPPGLSQFEQGLAQAGLAGGEGLAKAQAMFEAFLTPKGQLPIVVALTVGLALATRRRRLLFSEHLIFALQLQAFGNLLGGLGTVLHVGDGGSFAVSFAYDAVAFVRVYGFGWWGSLWRYALAITITYALLLGGFLLVALGLALSGRW